MFSFFRPKPQPHPIAPLHLRPKARLIVTPMVMRGDPNRMNSNWVDSTFPADFTSGTILFGTEP